MTTITKLEAAQRQLIAAVRLFFDDGDPVCVHTLASAARGIVHGECERIGVRDLFEDAKPSLPDRTRKDWYTEANRFANAFKHSKEDQGRDIEGFDDTANDSVLFVAIHDFGRILAHGNSGPPVWMPAPLEAFEHWFLACHANKLGAPEADAALSELSDVLNRSPRSEAKAIGRAMMQMQFGPPNQPPPDLSRRLSKAP